MALLQNELRIGNLVGLEDSEWNGFNQFFEFMENSEVKSFLDDKNKYAIVKTISNEIELMVYDIDIDFYSLSEIQPIPLTEDWLIRFGFEKDENNWYKLSICNDWTNLYWERLAGVELSVNKHSVMQPHIKYVHQLQNLYFALTGTELTLKK